MNDRYKSILALRAIRTFDDRAIDDADLDAVLDAARWTGSSKNTQNWAFIVVDDPRQKDRLCGAGDFMDPVRNAPAVICLVQEMLAADALGLSSCPVTLHREEIAAEVLGLPDGTRCRYGIAIGYPTTTSDAAKMGGRRPLVELVHRNRYGR